MFLFISIHAPAKGATQHEIAATGSFLKFQSTLPRRERQKRQPEKLPLVYFNPRSREGSDRKNHEFYLSGTKFQSTLPRRERLNVLAFCALFGNFNPRSREGSDYLIIFQSYLCRHFNPRSREGSDLSQIRAASFGMYFNPRSREGSDRKAWSWLCVSI